MMLLSVTYNFELQCHIYQLHISPFTKQRLNWSFGHHRTPTTSLDRKHYTNSHKNITPCAFKLYVTLNTLQSTLYKCFTYKC